MQINSSQLTSAFNIRPDSAQNDRARVPVTIDSQPVFEVEEQDQNQTLPVISAATKQLEITTNDSQQARFVRFFATQDQSSSESDKNLPAVLPPALPKGVQQYLQISQIPSSVQSLVDEIV